MILGSRPQNCGIIDEDHSLHLKTNSIIGQEDYESHIPIVIDGNTQLVEMAQNEGWEGNGSPADPYLIQNYEIASNSDCITIKNVSLYFFIVACSITSEVSGDSSTGVLVIDSSHIAVFSSEISNKGTGIFLSNVSDCRISGNNIAYNLANGLEIDEYCFHIVAYGNFFYGNGEHNAVDSGSLNKWNFRSWGNYWDDYEGPDQYVIPGSASSSDLFPTLYEQLEGFLDVNHPPDLEFVAHSRTRFLFWVFRAETAWSLDVNIEGKHSVSAVGSNPTEWMSISVGVSHLDPGTYTVAIEIDADGHTVYDSVDVTVVESPYEKHSSIWAYDDETLQEYAEEEEWEGDGSEGSPFMIEGYSIDGMARCIRLKNTRQFVNIRGCQIVSFWNDVKGSSISFENVTNVRIDSCTIERFEYGLSLINSSDCVIANNTFLENEIAFDCESSNRIDVVNNTVERSWRTGLELNWSSACNVFSNRIVTSYRGIGLTNMSLSSFHNNTIENNLEYGITLDEDCTENEFVFNRIGPNRRGNAIDNGTNNRWDDGVQFGNTWSDYDGEGFYHIPGLAGSIDHYPYRLVTSTTTTSPPDSAFPDIPLLETSLILSAGIVVLILIIVARKKQS